jgi:hypothetical protein
MQRLSAYAGLAYLCPYSYLSLHHTWGPWLAYRAVILFEEPLVTLEKPQPLPNPCPEALTSMQTAMAEALATPKGPESWRKWLQVRDMCALGKGYRYSEEQILYHYTKCRGLLEDLRR